MHTESRIGRYGQQGMHVGSTKTYTGSNTRRQETELDTQPSNLFAACIKREDK